MVRMRSLMTLVVFATLLGCNATVRTPLSTPIGEPNGTPVQERVGALGGVVTSGDRRAVLTLPEGR